jgi:hypothetical protein
MRRIPRPASHRVPSNLPVPPARIEWDRHVAGLRAQLEAEQAGDDPGGGRRRIQRDGSSTKDPSGLHKPDGSFVLETEEGRLVSSPCVVFAQRTLLERSIERFLHAACARLAVK